MKKVFVVIRYITTAIAINITSIIIGVLMFSLYSSMRILFRQIFYNLVKRRLPPRHKGNLNSLNILNINNGYENICAIIYLMSALVQDIFLIQEGAAFLRILKVECHCVVMPERRRIDAGILHSGSSLK